LAKVLPRPGTWMVRLKEFMAFPLWGTAVWLLFVLGQQLGSLAVALVLGTLIFIGLGVWAVRNFKGPARLVWGLVAALGVGASLFLFQGTGPVAVAETDPNSSWIPFSPERLEELRSENKPVFINFTAAWCISCQVNDQTTFRNSDVQAYVQDKGVIMMKADWTNRDATIGAVLQDYGRAGVPLYLFFAPGAREAVILPEVLTPAIFKEHVVF